MLASTPHNRHASARLDAQKLCRHANHWKCRVVIVSIPLAGGLSKEGQRPRREAACLSLQLSGSVDDLVARQLRLRAAQAFVITPGYRLHAPSE
jgi:hypothetical protein